MTFLDDKSFVDQSLSKMDTLPKECWTVSHPFGPSKVDGK
jgi:hypothetical protein